MLAIKILEVICKKYVEVKAFYCESLNITSKILSVLNDIDYLKAPDYIDEREKSIYSAEKIMNEIKILSSEFVSKNKLNSFTTDEIAKISPENSKIILDLRKEIIDIIKKIKSLEQQINAKINTLKNNMQVELRKNQNIKNIGNAYGRNVTKDTKRFSLII